MHHSEEPFEQPIRVLIADIPAHFYAYLAELITAEPDMVLVGSATGSVEILLAADEGVDIIVMATSSTEQMPGVCTHVLSAHPDTKILMIVPDDETLIAYWRGLRWRRMRHHTKPLPILRQIRHLHELNPAA